MAIKIIHRALAGRRYAERFLRETRLAARVAHPNLVRLYDAGRAADGRPFMVTSALRACCCGRRMAGGARLDGARASLRSMRIDRDLRGDEARLVAHRGEAPWAPRSTLRPRPDIDAAAHAPRGEPDRRYGPDHIKTKNHKKKRIDRGEARTASSRAPPAMISRSGTPGSAPHHHEEPPAPRPRRRLYSRTRFGCATRAASLVSRRKRSTIAALARERWMIWIATGRSSAVSRAPRPRPSRRVRGGDRSGSASGTAPSGSTAHRRSSPRDTLPRNS